MPARLAAVACAVLVLALAGCGEAKYAGPDWRLSDAWVPLAGPPAPPADNALSPRSLYGVGRGAMLGGSP